VQPPATEPPSVVPIVPVAPVTPAVPVIEPPPENQPAPGQSPESGQFAIQPAPPTLVTGTGQQHTSSPSTPHLGGGGGPPVISPTNPVTPPNTGR
jgi:hypothetical protein